MNRKVLFVSLAAIVLLVIALMRNPANTKDSRVVYQQHEGTVFHTIYHIRYRSDESHLTDIQRLFREFDGSLSMFNDTSIITRMNRNDITVRANDYVRTVLTKGFEVSDRTDGAFDMTVAPLVNLWGFGFKHSDKVSQQAVDSILQFVGYKGVTLMPDGRLIKQDPRTILDASSIAKGYMCDVVGDYLKSVGITDFMVEIGGEITLSGVNPNGNKWTVAINVPQPDSLMVGQETIQDVLSLTDCGIATSGNYRNFYEKDGKRYAHTIDPHSGYPIQQDILSSTVIASDCMTADAYATSFMVLGSEKALQVLEKDSTLMAYFILQDTVIYSPRLKELLPKH